MNQRIGFDLSVKSYQLMTRQSSTGHSVLVNMTWQLRDQRLPVAQMGPDFQHSVELRKGLND